MSLRNIILFLALTFAVAWCAVIVVPYFKMRDLAPIGTAVVDNGTTGVFYPKRAGRIASGAEVYAENGCYQCHSQLIRPTYAGNDLYRPDWAGLITDDGDSRRETNAYDYSGESYAQIGVMRLGPDLSNVGLRVTKNYAKDSSPEAWLYKHLLDPRSMADRWDSTCPPHPFLFETREIKGQASDEAVRFKDGGTREVVPSSDARALVSYLLSMIKDQPVPPELDFAPKSKP